MNFQDDNDEFAKQLIAELLDANAEAFAVLAGAVADVVGRPALAAALSARLARAQAAQDHPTRDGLLATALRALKQGS